MKLAIASALALGAFSFTPQGPVAETPAPIAPSTGFVAFTSYTHHIRLVCDSVSGSTYNFRVFNYQPGAFGTTYPKEHPTYTITPAAQAGFIVNGVLTMFTPNADGELVCSLTLPTSGSGHRIDFGVLDPAGQLVFLDTMDNLYIF